MDNPAEVNTYLLLVLVFLAAFSLYENLGRDPAAAVPIGLALVGAGIVLGVLKHG